MHPERRLSLLLAAVLAALVMAGCGGDQDDTPARSDAAPGLTAAAGDGATLAQVPGIYRKLEPSVVAIEVRGAQGSGEGSGVVYEPRRIVTNHHVIAGAREVVVALASGDRISRTVS